MLLTFGLVILAGTVLLWLPFTDADGQHTTFIEALFTAVSGVCVTGLVVVDTQEHYNFLGEVVILALIQIGGLGYMVGTSLFLWALGRQLGLRDRFMLRQYYGAPSMGETVSFAKRVTIYAVGLEAAGACVLYISFVAAGVGADTAVWWSIFHSLSAFNNAGFNVTGADMNLFVGEPAILLTITALVILGGLGALPVLTFMARRSFRRLPLDHKLIFATTGVLLALGTLFYLLVEWDRELSAAQPAERPAVALFQASMPRTAGFSAIDIGEVTDESKLAGMGLMFVGGAAGSTAGGLKVGAFSLLFFALLATIRGREEVTVFRRAVPPMIVRQALALALLFVGAVVAVTMALTLTHDGAPLVDLLFEAVSALSTVGHSAGITADFGTTGRLILVLAMLIGRFGPLVLVLEMNRYHRQPIYKVPQDGIRLG